MCLILERMFLNLLLSVDVGSPIGGLRLLLIEDAASTIVQTFSLPFNLRATSDLRSGANKRPASYRTYCIPREPCGLRGAPAHPDSASKAFGGTGRSVRRRRPPISPGLHVLA